MPRPGERATLRGKIVKIAFQDPESGYTVARLAVDGLQEVTVVGEIFPVAAGEEIKVSGLWRLHPRYGLQFQSNSWEKLEPATLEGIERYLGSGLIKGIGPIYARRLVSTFGLDTLRVLSEEPHRLREVEGVGPVRAQRITQAWEQQRGMRDALVFLQGLGMGITLALKIHRAFGAQSAARVRENPYCLAREIHGVGFLMADRIAGRLGIDPDSPLRAQAALLHLLRKFTDEGHCYVPTSALAHHASSLIGREELIRTALASLEQQGEIVLEESSGLKNQGVYLKELYRAECRVATALRRLLSTSSGLRDEGMKGLRDSNPLTLDLFSSSTVLLEKEQQEALLQALRHKVLVITGGPGTGKTTLLTSLLAWLRHFKVSFALAAPTGRAAKRMGEIAGEEAKTIHRLLEYSPIDGGFQRKESHPLGADVVIIDEASMVDLFLMDNLLSAVKPQSHLILLGDVDQLPSVGPGSVLKDLIHSGAVPVVVLRRIFRQARESLIVANAHRILQGQALMLGTEREREDFVFIACEGEAEILETIKKLVKEGPRDQEIMGLRDKPSNPLTLKLLSEIQVLTPMHRGLLGTIHLNRELQNLWNPEGAAVGPGERLFRIGDRVMQLRNNYEKGVFNGDLGKIVGADQEEGELQVDFDGRWLSYGFDELDEIDLAYATSIHKSQGSEYPAVVIPLHTSHYPMLHRSILYTAVTRGKELVVLVGSRKALMMAIKNARIQRRFTGLKERLSSP